MSVDLLLSVRMPGQPHALQHFGPGSTEGEIVRVEVKCKLFVFFIPNSLLTY